MTKDGSFKRAVRRNARGSGETYTEALARMHSEDESFDLAQQLEVGTDLETGNRLKEEAEKRIPPNGPLDVQFARSLAKLYARLGDRDSTLELIERLLAQQLDIEDGAWARELQVTLMSRPPLDRADAERAVEAHRGFLQWGRENLPPERWHRLLGISTYAWREIGAFDEWLAAWRMISAVAPGTEATRQDRIARILTAASSLNILGRINEARDAMAQIAAVLGEDPDWSPYPGWPKELTSRMSWPGRQLAVEMLMRSNENLKFPDVVDREESVAGWGDGLPAG